MIRSFRSSTPYFSILVPFRNEERFLERAIKSLKRQTFFRFEVILIDDGSEDNSVLVAKQSIGSDRRFRVTTASKSSIGAARNQGIRLARGVRIMFLDADDDLRPNSLWILYLASIILKPDVLLFSAKARFEGMPTPKNAMGRKILRIRRAERILRLRRNGLKFARKTGPDALVKLENSGAWLPGAAFLSIDVAFQQKCNLFFPEGTLHEDVMFTLRAIAESERVTLIPARLYTRTVRPDSVTGNAIRNHQAGKKSIVDLSRVLDELEKYIQTMSTGSDLHRSALKIMDEVKEYQSVIRAKTS